ncbi:MAG: glycosyltransferase family 2 protein [Acidobacteriota bacterium]|nr:glycosyltransferase family 2 protein [Blastocatellia bacterium]MDW8411739.1 glycosyltransferase family 2 protein [Acidobacteriota bacterium]
MYPSVSIIIPNWNGRCLLEKFLPTVIAAAEKYHQKTLASIEVIVVDDCSDDDSLPWLEGYSRHLPVHLKVVARQLNGGFARAANSGFLAASHEIIVLLNNDISVEPDAILPLVRHFTNPKVFAVCCKAFRLGTDFFDGAGKLGLFRRGHWRVYVNYDILPTLLASDVKLYSFVASGGYAAFDAAKLKQLGGFCELLSPFYWEDVELCYRAWKRGWTIEYEPESIVYHQTSSTIGTCFRPMRVRVIAERNRLLMHWINLHDRRWLLLHIFWTAMKLLAAAFKLDFVLWRALYQALCLLDEVGKLRAQEKLSSLVTDREISALFEKLLATKGIYPISKDEDYYRYLELRRSLEGN